MPIYSIKHVHSWKNKKTPVSDPGLSEARLEKGTSLEKYSQSE